MADIWVPNALLGHSQIRKVSPKLEKDLSTPTVLSTEYEMDFPGSDISTRSKVTTVEECVVACRARLVVCGCGVCEELLNV